MPEVYGALFDINLLRDDVRALRVRREMTDDDEERILTRLELLEAAALLIIERFEQLHEIAAH